MTATLTDARTELVLSAADDIAHILCEDCWKPGMPMMCGSPDSGEDGCPEGCDCPTCPLCEEEWTRHERAHLPWWKRWFS